MEILILALLIILLTVQIFVIYKLQKVSVLLKNASIIQADNRTEDELYDAAKRIVLEAGIASASLLQRRLRVGYARAASLLDMLEEEGIVGPAIGSKPREVKKVENL